MRRITGLSMVLAAAVMAGSCAPKAEVAGAGAPVFPASIAACEALAKTRFDGFEVVGATSQAANEPVEGARLMSPQGVPGAGPEIEGLPAFCRVVGKASPEPGSNIGFEVWLPAQGWDGRLHGVGVGGFAGWYDYRAMGLAISGHQAAVITDTGHGGGPHEADWAVGQPARVRDYGWRGVHESTVAAKAIIRAFYGRKPDKSYFLGCSNGGRQGLMEAARFPDDYDGIVAGAPAARFSRVFTSMVHPMQAQMAPGAGIRPEQIGLLQEEVLRQCDAPDGQKDGLIEDPRQCRFDASRLACGTSTSDQCFSQPQIAALDAIHSGPRDAAGRQVAPGYLPSGGEAGWPAPMFGWEGFLAHGQAIPTMSRMLATGLLGKIVANPFATVESFDMNRDPARLQAALAADLDVSPDLSRFFARGGKLIVWHGWSDAAIPAELMLEYHRDMLASSGPAAARQSRLFMVPGVQHCFGGPGPMAFGQANGPEPGESAERSMAVALQEWVEGRRPAPESFVGRRGMSGIAGTPAMGPERQRLLCAWPKKAILTSGADPDRADSYRCLSR